MSIQSISRVLYIASKNKGKIIEFKNLLKPYDLEIIPQPEFIDIDETGDSFLANARQKAFTVAKLTGELALADDSGLSVKSLKGAPGIKSARYADSDQERINRLLKELHPFSDRTAFFTSALCLVTPTGNVLAEVEARCDGVILKSPKGDGGFGYDPIFEVDGTGLTFAQMSKDQKQLFGHRGIALKKLEVDLIRVFS